MKTKCAGIASFLQKVEIHGPGLQRQVGLQDDLADFVTNLLQ